MPVPRRKCSRSVTGSRRRCARAIDVARDGVARLERGRIRRQTEREGDGPPLPSTPRRWRPGAAVLPVACGTAGRGAPLELARTRLLFGEWLRRKRKRKEARGHLRAASETFERLGCGPLAARAREELRATGETMATTRSHRLASLTPQELAISRLVAEGASNRRGHRPIPQPPNRGVPLTQDLHQALCGSRTELAHLVATVGLRPAPASEPA